MTPEAFVALLAMCAPDAPAKDMLRIALVESGLRPDAIHRNANASVDVGIMQVNSANFGRLGLTMQTALDPCRSVAAGWRVLAGFSGYNTGSPTAGFRNGYVQRVMAQHTEPAPDGARDHEPAVPVKPSCAPSWDMMALAMCQHKPGPSK